MRIILTNSVYLTSVLLLLQSFLCCSPKSYCFLHTKEANIQITDTSRFRSITITKTTPENRSKREIIHYKEFETPVGLYKLPIDSVIKNSYIEITIKTTNYRERYFLSIYPSEWKSDSLKKFKAQIR